MKWVVLASLLLAAALCALLYELRASDATAAPALPVAAPAPTPAPTALDAVADSPTFIRPGIPPALPPDPEVQPPLPQAPLLDGDLPDEFKKGTDEFYERIDETYARRLTSFTAPCYQGGKHRKEKIRIAFRFQIKDGVVSVKDARVDESTLTDPALTTCMLTAIQNARWDDPRMPDWATRPDEEETVLIRMENLKRFGAPR